MRCSGTRRSLGALLSAYYLAEQGICQNGTTTNPGGESGGKDHHIARRNISPATEHHVIWHGPAPFSGGCDLKIARAGTAWRSGRDSNPRYAFDVYSLSRRAPSTTRPPLRMPGRGRPSHSDCRPQAIADVLRQRPTQSATSPATWLAAALSAMPAAVGSIAVTGTRASKRRFSNVCAARAPDAAAGRSRASVAS